MKIKHLTFCFIAIPLIAYQYSMESDKIHNHLKFPISCFFAIGDGRIDWNDDLHLLENEYGIPIITYPSTEIMKDVKMYPPYK